MDTIISPATGLIKSALAIIRLSGDTCYELIEKQFSKKLPEDGGRIIYGNLFDLEGNIIDEVTLMCFKGPKSFTGEDVIEINCHGSLLIINKIMETFIALGARKAERGEFTSRAFYNGKIDLVQAESINELINSKTDAQRKLSLFALKGKTSSTLIPLRNALADVLANIEVNIDYPEYEDIEQVSNEKVLETSHFALKEIDKLLNLGKKASLLVQGINVAIVGRPNVGKSSLLNALLNEDKAIVTEIPGTTRDIVEGEIDINGLLMHIIDTAGIRNSSDIVESLGIKKAEEMIKKADLIIYLKDDVNDVYQELEELIKGKQVITVINKKDLIKNYDKNYIYISALNHDIDDLKNKISKIYDLEKDVEPSLCSAREIGLLNEAKLALLEAIKEQQNNSPLDLISIYIKQSYDAIKRILGEEVNPDLEKEVFSRFCVGK